MNIDNFIDRVAARYGVTGVVIAVTVLVGTALVGLVALVAVISMVHPVLLLVVPPAVLAAMWWSVRNDD